MEVYVWRGVFMEVYRGVCVWKCVNARVCDAVCVGMGALRCSCVEQPGGQFSALPINQSTQSVPSSIQPTPL